MWQIKGHQDTYFVDEVEFVVSTKSKSYRKAGETTVVCNIAFAGTLGKYKVVLLNDVFDEKHPDEYGRLIILDKKGKNVLEIAAVKGIVNLSDNLIRIDAMTLGASANLYWTIDKNLKTQLYNNPEYNIPPRYWLYIKTGN